MGFAAAQPILRLLQAQQASLQGLLGESTMKLPHRRQFLHLAAGAAALPALSHGARAQGYPTQPVRILVGFAPGVAPDITGRLFADKFSAAWDKPVVVENVTGAGGNIATERVAKAAPDGYTLLMGGNSSLIFSPSMYDKLPYDPIRDFAPITRVFVAANILVVHNDVPARTLSELIALARAQPGKLTYAHAGAGTSQHLAAELLKFLEKIDIQPVAYRGTTALLPDLLAGRVTMSFANVANVAPLLKEGKLRGLAVSSRKRSTVAPDMPTMIELGYRDFEAVPWFGLMAPAGTPTAVVQKIYREALHVMAMPDVRKSLLDIGLDLIGDTPAEFSATIEREIPQWAKVIKSANIKPD
jgi:tripartite-type tricarboxylate transporter receptor subunit TctC